MRSKSDSLPAVHALRSQPDPLAMASRDETHA
jgi:hypothetical protein